jgi:hypothetical protein
MKCVIMVIVLAIFGMGCDMCSPCPPFDQNFEREFDKMTPAKQQKCVEWINNGR